MLKKKWIYLFGFFVLISFTTKHPFYLSLIEAQHNIKEQSVEISIRIFIDDFENNLAKIHPNLKVDFNNVANKTLNDKLVFEYIKQKLQLSINNTPKTLQYVGFEIQQESIWIYAEVPQNTIIKSLNASCTVMYDFNVKQVNIFRAKANSEEKNTKLDFPKSTVNFNW
jgi:hypothetical protein